MTWNDAQKYIPNEFNDLKIVNCQENNNYLIFTAVPKDAKP